MREETMHLPIDNALADAILVAFLKQHMQWTQEEIDRTTHPEDKDEAELDLIAMKRLYKYVTGETA